MQDACYPTTSFNISETAGLYSQLAGVLAGFAFSAIFFVLSTRLSPGVVISDLARTLRLMICGFVTLVLSSLFYALLAGETSNSGRAAMVQLVNAAGFISAGTLLLLSLLALLNRIEHASMPSGAGPAIPASGSIPLLRAVLAHGLPLILSLSLYSGVDDYSDARHQLESFRFVDLIAVLAAAIALIGPVVAYALPKHTNPITADLYEKGLAYSAVLLAVASTAVSFLISASIDPCATLGEWSIVIVVAVPVTFMMVVSVHLTRAR